MNKFKIRISITLTFLFAISSARSFGQNETIKHTTRNFIWFIPSKAIRINGVAIGPLESSLFFDKTQKINGITFVFVGSGLLLPMMPYDPLDKFFFNKLSEASTVFLSLDSMINDNKNISVHNGIMLSSTGVMGANMNGISLSLFCGFLYTLNGVSLNPFVNINHLINGVAIGAYNSAGKVKGLQIGIFNRAVNLKGFQIGIWNKTRKRSLPFFNWG